MLFPLSLRAVSSQFSADSPISLKAFSSLFSEYHPYQLDINFPLSLRAFSFQFERFLHKIWGLLTIKWSKFYPHVYNPSCNIPFRHRRAPTSANRKIKIPTCHRAKHTPTIRNQRDLNHSATTSCARSPIRTVDATPSSFATQPIACMNHSRGHFSETRQQQQAQPLGAPPIRISNLGQPPSSMVETAVGTKGAAT